MADDFLDLVSDLKGQLEEKITLDEINQKILGSLDIDEVMREIRDGAVHLLECDRCTVYMVTKNEKGERELVSRTTVDGQVKSIVVPFNHDSISGFVACTGKPMRLVDVYDKAELEAISPLPKFDSTWDKKTGYRSQSMLVAPAFAHTKVVGVIQALNKKSGAFADRDLETLQKMAGFVGIALQNSQAHTEILRRDSRRLTFDELLIKKNLLTDIRLHEAQEKARSQKRKLVEVLIGEYDLSEATLTQVMAEVNGVEFIAFSKDLTIDPTLFENLPEADCKRRLICPLRLTLDQNGEPQLALAMVNPKDFITIEDVEIRCGLKVNKVFMATKTDLLAMIASSLHPGAAAEEHQEGVGDLFDQLAESLGVKKEEEVAVEAVAIKEGANEDDAPIVKLCNRIIEDAYRRGSTDIHIEPMEKEVLIRVRRDGELEKMLTIPGHARNALVARYKIMGDMNITEHRIPQDGRIRFKEHGGRYDVELRVNICPTVGGNEDIVMRILAASKPKPLDKLGLVPWVYEPLMKELNKPYGMILCVGPTGSGKTTTLHSAVATQNTPNWKILTAENPVEITQQGLRQVQIKPEVGLTFKEALRAFLRQDPDIILVGEMRDFETCSIAVEAALTGHLLLSTLHTNSAPETITRLVDIGIDPVTLSDALLCVLAQRLPKTICGKCAQARPLTDEELKDIRATREGEHYVFAGRKLPVADSKVKGPGCDNCRGTGYAGRMGVHELLVCTPEIRKMICSGARIAEIRECARTPSTDGGFRMYELYEDGMFKVLGGRSDAYQVRVVCNE